MNAFTPLLGVCLGLLLLLALEQGFKYGNPLPAWIPLEDRLTSTGTGLVFVLGSTAVLLALIAVLAWDFTRWH